MNERERGLHLDRMVHAYFNEQPPEAFSPPRQWIDMPPIVEMGPTERVNSAVLDILSEVTPTLSAFVDRGVGKGIISQYVPGREEDVEIEIDDLAETMLRRSWIKAARMYGLSFNVLSEHNNFKVGQNGESDFYVVQDPFDNSAEYNRGLTTPPFLVFSLFTPEGEPVAGGASNLATGHVYINRDGDNYEYNPRYRDLHKLEPQRGVRGIDDPNFVVASYEGRYEYTTLFRKHFEELDADRFRKSTFHAKGGAFIYPAEIASGATSLYIMFNEPRGEIDAGLAFAQSAEYHLVSVDRETGDTQSYKFDPHLQHETVPLFIAAQTWPLLGQAIGYYQESIRVPRTIIFQAPQAPEAPDVATA